MEETWKSHWQNQILEPLNAHLRSLDLILEAEQGDYSLLKSVWKITRYLREIEVTALKMD